METSRLARTVALASFLGTASLIGGAAFEALGPEEAEAYNEVDESYFYTSLAPHGSWVSSADYGWVWYPHHRPRGWRPYTVGHWAYTDYGDWLWVSAEPFGWATYHYGRWYLDPFYGWVWIPGRVWAPAWVSWRDCDDYIGWAPLGPWGYWDAYYHRYRGWNRWDRWHHGDHDGHHGGHDGHHGDHDGDWDHDGDHHGDHDGDWDRDDHDYTRNVRGDDRDSWNFTRKRDFAGTRVDKVMVGADKVPGLFGRSRPLPPPSEDDERAGRGITRAVDRHAIERASGRPIRPVKVEDDKAPPMHGGGSATARNEPGSDRVRVFRPNVKDKPGAKTPDQLGLAKAPNRGGRGDDVRSGSPGNRGDGRSRSEDLRRNPQAGGGRGADIGGRERPARDDERGGYERPARADEHGGYVNDAKDRTSERQPAGSRNGRTPGGMKGGSSDAPQLERHDDPTQPRGHQVQRYERPAGAPQRSAVEKPVSQRPRVYPYDAPTAGQRRIEKPQTPVSREAYGGGSPQRGEAPNVHRGGSPTRHTYSGEQRGYTGSNPGASPGGSPGRSSYGGYQGSGHSGGGPSPGGYHGGSPGGSPGGSSGARSGGGSDGGGRSAYSGGGSHGGYPGGGSSPGGYSQGGSSGGYSGGGGGHHR